MIKELKKEIYREIKQFMLKKLFSHRKAKLGLVSAQNQLLSDLNRMLYEWSESDLCYIDLKLKKHGFPEQNEKK